MKFGEIGFFDQTKKKGGLGGLNWPIFGDTKS